MRANKIVLLGSAGVGKTSFITTATRLFRGISCYKPTVGVEYHRIKTYINDKEELVHICRGDELHNGILGPSLDLWDTAGQERFYSLTPMYTRGAIVAVVMHEGTPSSMERVKQEVHRLREDNPIIKIFLIQTKSDTGTKFNYDLVHLIEADGWAYICTIQSDLSSVDNALKSICELALKVISERAHPSQEDTPIELLTPHTQRCMCLIN
jgi:small GTP-binding protein